MMTGSVTFAPSGVKLKLSHAGNTSPCVCVECEGPRGPGLISDGEQGRKGFVCGGVWKEELMMTFVFHS